MLSSASINGLGCSFINFRLFCKTPVDAQELGGSGQAMHGRRWQSLSRDHQGQPGAQASRDGDVSTHMSPLGSEALIRRQDHSRACSTYLLTSCFLGAMPNKAANNQPRRVQPLAELGPQKGNQPPQPQPPRRLPRHPFTFFFFLLSKGSVK